MEYARKYYVYIIANRHKNMIYTGVTNDLKRRINEHYSGIFKGFSKKFNCRYLVYYEVYDNILLAIQREKQIKNLRRAKKNKLIADFNPEWKFLNESILSIADEYL
jgi:putative endonuclease